MSEPTFIDNLFAIQQAVREGREWEFVSSNGVVWMSPTIKTLDNLNELVAVGYRVRLKPEPPKPRWWSKSSDVPGPVCWIRTHNSGSAHLITGITSDGFFAVHGALFYFTETSLTGVEYSTDRITWKPCTSHES